MKTPTDHFLLDLIDRLNRACDELTFIGAGIGANLDANEGAHFLLQGVCNNLSDLAQRAQEVVDDGETEAPKPEPTPPPTVPPLTDKQRCLVKLLAASVNDGEGSSHA